MIDRQTRLGALERQIQRVESRLIKLHQRSDRLSLVRVGVFLGGLVVTLAAFIFGDWLGWLALAAWWVAFGVAVYAHRVIEGSARRHEVWLRLKRQHVARMTLDWKHIPLPRSAPVPADHPFAFDLDLVGERSIHQLMNTAGSQEGGARLQNWLLDTAPDQPTIAHRQDIVHELTPLARFRDKLSMHALLQGSTQLEGERLLRWLRQRAPANTLRLPLIILGLLAAASAALLVGHVAGALPPLWAITLLAYGGGYITQWERIKALFEDTLYMADALRRLRAVLGYLERYPYGNHPHLGEVCAPLLRAGRQPMRIVRGIGRLAAAASLQGNPILWMLVNAVVPWDVFFAHQLNRRKAELGDLLPEWLDVWYEVEALSSLAHFAYLNPGYTFPQIDTDGDVIFAGQQLGHPLILAQEKVCNDFALHAVGEVIIITGSNMAGKSSFLRTVGVNLALAYAGSVVDAAALHTSLFRLFTAIRVTDSVIDGISYFYAEVKRLKALLDAIERDNERPLFFLIDEIFKGTNNRERLIGSRAYIKTLAGKRGLGLVATHDLELVRLAEDIPAIQNYHFRETVQDSRMVFDYTLRPGPCPTTNALKIMALEGLPVETGERENLT